MKGTRLDYNYSNRCSICKSDGDPDDYECCAFCGAHTCRHHGKEVESEDRETGYQERDWLCDKCNGIRWVPS